MSAELLESATAVDPGDKPVADEGAVADDMLTEELLVEELLVEEISIDGMCGVY